MTDIKFFWAYRYSDTSEPAIVMTADRKFDAVLMHNIASHSPTLSRKLEWVCTDINVSLFRVLLDETELNLWLAFELCPFVEALFNDEDKIYMFNTQVEP